MKNVVLTDARGNVSAIRAAVPSKDAKVYKSLLNHLSSINRQSFQGARNDRFNSAVNWGSFTAINSTLESELTTLRQRSRHFECNNKYVKGALNSFLNYIVGTGFSLQMSIFKTLKVGGKVKKEELSDLNNYIEDIFNDWSVNAGYSSNSVNYIGLQDLEEMFLQRLLVDGEVFMRFHYDTTNREVPLAVEVIDPNYIYSGITEHNGNPVVMGIELEKTTGKPLAYFIQKYRFNATEAYDVERVPASDLSHVFRRVFPWQVRGIPSFSVVMDSVLHLNQYVDDQLIRSRIASMFGLIISGGAGTNGGLLDDMLQEQGVLGENTVDENGFPVDTDGNMISTLKAGMIGKVPEGYEVNTVNPSAPELEFNDFMRTGLTSFGTGIDVGLSYTGLTRDTSKTTFAGGRMQENQDIQGFKRLIRFFTQNLLSPIVRRFLSVAVLTDNLRLPDYFEKPLKWQRHVWMQSGWSRGINPLQDASASEKLLEMGVTTEFDECALMGKDFATQVKKSGKASLLKLQEFKLLKDEALKMGLSDEEFANVMGIEQKQEATGGGTGAQANP